jgi:small subunit ribosomal protein S20
MANHASATKAHRQSLRRRDVNRRNLSRLRGDLRSLRETVAAGDAAAAQKMLPATLSLIDKSIQKGILHDNAAARHKSRLTRLVSKLGQARSAKS